jgi:hypothetical protein
MKRSGSYLWRLVQVIDRARELGNRRLGALIGAWHREHNYQRTRRNQWPWKMEEAERRSLGYDDVVKR